MLCTLKIRHIGAYLMLATTLILSACKKESTEVSVTKVLSAPAMKELTSGMQTPGHFDQENKYWVIEMPGYETAAQKLHGDTLTGYTDLRKHDADGNHLSIGLLDNKGKVIIPPRYFGIQVGFTNGLCQVSDENNKYDLYTETGACIASGCDDTGDLVDGLILIGKNGKYGFINQKGEIIIPITYKSLGTPSEGLIAFMDKPQRWGYINFKNKVVIPPLFTFTAAFENGKVQLQKADGEDYIVYADGRIEKAP